MSETILDRVKSVETAEVSGKRVLIRCDLNVPMADGVVTDATRLERVAPSIKNLADKGARVIVMSHFGRPKGERIPEMSLKPVAEKLSEILGLGQITFADDCIGDVAECAVKDLGNGEVVVLENLRYHSGEEKNDPEFVKSLAALGDIYVNDAFSAAHRAHASTAGLADILPAYAGPLLMAEVQALTLALEAPQRPVVAIVGGAKVSSKIPVLDNMVQKVDKLIIGGGMANTFLFAQGYSVGKSLCEPDFVETAKAVLEKAASSGCEILLQTDSVVAKEFKENAENQVCTLDNCPEDGMILDAGPATLEMLKGKLAECRTLLWNGPLGAFEISPFGEATFGLAKAAAAQTKAGNLVSIAGGGDTVAALNTANVSDDFTYISTAGGAFLEWLEGRELPGIAALTKAG